MLIFLIKFFLLYFEIQTLLYGTSVVLVFFCFFFKYSLIDISYRYVAFLHSFAIILLFSLLKHIVLYIQLLTCFINKSQEYLSDFQVIITLLHIIMFYQTSLFVFDKNWDHFTRNDVTIFIKSYLIDYLFACLSLLANYLLFLIFLLEFH